MQPICEAPINSVVKYKSKLYALTELINAQYHLQGEFDEWYVSGNTPVELITTPAALALWFAGVKAGEK